MLVTLTLNLRPRELANAGYEEARLKELKALAESQPKQV